MNQALRCEGCGIKGELLKKVGAEGRYLNLCRDCRGLLNSVAVYISTKRGETRLRSNARLMEDE